MKTTEQPLEKTLYNRLNDDMMKDLDAMATKYPTVARDIRNALKEVNNFMSLEYQYLSFMRDYLGMDLNNVHRYFKPIGE